MPSNNKTASCPECQAKVTLKKAPRLGQTIVCKGCHTLLEVIEANPLELDWASDDDFDEEDDDFDGDYAYDDDFAYADEDD